MAEADLLTRILGEIKARHEELRPYAEELPLLQSADLALNNHSSHSSRAKPAVRRRRRLAAKPSTSAPAAIPSPKRQTRGQASAAPAPRAASPHKRKGANQQAVQGVLRAADGPLTARQVADAAGLDPSMAHSVLGKLASRGDAKLTKGPDGRKLYTAAGHDKT